MIGLNYFDLHGRLLNHVQHSGEVVHVEAELGISVKILSSSEEIDSKDTIIVDSQRIFLLPSTPTAWFIAPQGTYRRADGEKLIEDPDYFVAWDIHLKSLNANDHEHLWWEWRPQTTPPCRADLVA